MPKAKESQIVWLTDVEEHDYPAAESYLRLLYPDEAVRALVQRLRQAGMAQFKAKDIFRASQLSLLGISNAHVQRDSQKISAGVALSPLLLCRETQLGRLVIADGYHRLCAVYGVDEDALIPCKIV